MSSFPKEDFSLTDLALRTKTETENMTCSVLQQSFDACNDKGCRDCLTFLLPKLIDHHKNLGTFLFISDIGSRSAGPDFAKAVQSFRESLRWASFWKEKNDLKMEIYSLEGTYCFRNPIFKNF